MNQTHYTIHGINGPVVKVTGGKGLAMMDMVSVGEEGLIGEVVSVDRSATTVQVYEDTAGLKPGQPVVSQGAPMAITLGPGMLTNIFDGIARPLKVIEAESGPFICLLYTSGTSCGWSTGACPITFPGRTSP